MALRTSISLTLALIWIALWEAVVPADRRATWRDQWRADLWHYWAWLCTARVHPITARVRLYRRAFAALPHAFVLRIRDWSPHMISHDLRFAWRMIVRRPAFTIIAVAILGLGVGANATIFSWVETTLLRPLPGVQDQDQLVALRGTTMSRSDLSFSYPNFLDLRAARPEGLDDIIAFRGLALSLRSGGSEPVRVWGELVTPNFFDVLRVRIVRGRGFTPSDGQTPGREPVAVLGYRAWQQIFQGDETLVGRTLTVNGTPFTVIGIADEGFQGSLVGVALDVFVPITMQRAVLSGDRLGVRGNSFLQVFGRLSPNASIAKTRASLSVIGARLATSYPDANGGRSIGVAPLWRNGASNLLLPVMATLMGVVGVVLLIACANLAGLLLARAAGRQREIAVRLAMGASRSRLIRQFLIESLLLAAGGGIAGIALSYWTAGLLRTFIPPTPLPIGFSAGISPAVIGFSILVTFVAAVVFGLVPALRASRPDVSATLKDAGASLTSGAGRGRLRQTLVVAQVALSVVLLVCASLFARSLQRAQVSDPGFTLRQGLLASIDLLSNGYDEPRGIVFFQQLQQRLQAIPGIESASVTAALPLDLSGGSDMGVRIDGYDRAPGEEITAYYNRVGSRYFETMGIPLVAGRALDDRDVDGRELAVVINETMARHYWPNRSALGGIVRFGSGPARVVGIVKDGKYRRLNEEPRNYMYLAVSQYYRPDLVVLVRTKGDPSGALAAVQSQVRALDPALPLFDVRTMEEHLQFSVFLPRMISTLLGLFGVLALVLAVVGLYGVIAYSVAQRTREIGIRMALGAARGSVVRMVLRQGLVLTGVGLAIGLGLAIAAGRVLSGQLIGISATDPFSFIATIAALMIVALAASVIPARRAAALDPLVALRTQ
jgi:macrolide transport system ATP-binding/permease protein